MVGLPSTAHYLNSEPIQYIMTDMYTSCTIYNIPVPHISPVHPVRQVQVYDPAVFTHVAPFTQPSVSKLHSSISGTQI